MAVKPKSVLTIKLSGEGKSHSRADVSVDGLNVIIDEPVVRGGTNEGPSPTATAYSALIGCTNVIGHKCADSLGIEIGNLHIAMEVDFDRRGVLLQEEVEVPFTAIRMDVAADGPASEADIQRVGEETARYCAISKLFERSGTELSVNWRKA